MTDNKFRYSKTLPLSGQFPATEPEACATVLLGPLHQLFSSLPTIHRKHRLRHKRLALVVAFPPHTSRQP